MAYLFGAGNSDIIRCGTAVTHGATFSAFIRFKPTSANATERRLLEFRQISSPFLDNFFLEFTSSGTNFLVFNFTHGGTLEEVNWTSGFAAGSIHTLVVVYDGATLYIYADTDSTPKATFNASFTPDQNADQEFAIGGLAAGFNDGADATIYEVGWWAGTVLTGAQAAAMGAGTPPVTNPTDYWPLVSDAVALFGGHNGTATGATVVAHSGANLYSAAPPAGPRYAIGSGFGGRRAVIGG